MKSHGLYILIACHGFSRGPGVASPGPEVRRVVLGQLCRPLFFQGRINFCAFHINLFSRWEFVPLSRKIPNLEDSLRYNVTDSIFKAFKAKKRGYQYDFRKNWPRPLAIAEE